MMELFIGILVLCVVIAVISVYDDMTLKGFKLDAKDGDKDGKVQEGTRWERKKR